MTTMTSLLLPTFRQMLGALANWLDKADGGDTLLAGRIAPDMFPLATQVRFACVQALEPVYRLTDRPVPASVTALMDEGRVANEGDAGTVADAKARIADTLGALDALSDDALDVAADKPVEHKIPNGMVFDLTAEQYARDWALPQFYFHLMTAYAILRAEGVALGKADYIPHMFPYIREGSMPAG